MRGDVHKQDGVIRGDCIQIIPVWVALLCDTGVIIAPANDPLSRLQLLFSYPISQDLLDIGNGTGFADGLGVQVGDRNFTDCKTT